MLHTTQSVTDHSRTTFPIVHCTNTAVCTDHAHTCKQSPNHHHPITHTHTHYISPGHSPIHGRVLLASLAYEAFPSFPSLFSCVLFDFPCSDSARAPGLFSLPCPLDIVRRSPTHACLRTILCLIPAIPVCYCLTLPVSTMFSNKALRMDPHVSRLVNPVTLMKYH